ncbi:hypothetical protein EZS27_031296 [termite gut metagenome]|uniref:Uncharacterized protein n=1 Tax=termite gut metagenome TaxID=433724 RepID=A0A5J4QDS2_9ZZZZ
MKNSRNILKQKLLPLLSNLHIIIGRWAKRLIIAGVVLALVFVALYWGVGVCLAVIAGFFVIRFIIPFLIGLTLSIIIPLVGIILLIVLILSLILLGVS